MADGCRSVPGFCRTGGLMARLDAVQKLSLVPWASKELNLIRPNGLFQNALFACFYPAAIHPYPTAVFTNPLCSAAYALVAAVSHMHIDAAFVFRNKVILSCGVPYSFGWVFPRTFYRFRSRVIPPHSPVGDVRVVANPIHQLSPAVIQLP